MDAWLDDGVCQLVAKLKQVGEHEKTLYVFVIDNGWCNGLVSKGSPFEKGLRTPIVFTLGGVIPAGQKFDDLVSAVDIYPTILDYAGVKVPETAAGFSLRPRIERRTKRRRAALCGAIYPAFADKQDCRPERDVYALYCRTERWKYILWLQDVTEERNRSYFRIQHILTRFPARAAGSEDLYDLAKDPYELSNLAADSDLSKIKDELRRRVLEWWQSTGGGRLGALKEIQGGSKRRCEKP
jgi:arylsulfatase A-like enzyme